MSIEGSLRDTTRKVGPFALAECLQEVDEKRGALSRKNACQDGHHTLVKQQPLNAFVEDDYSD